MIYDRKDVGEGLEKGAVQSVARDVCDRQPISGLLNPPIAIAVPKEKAVEQIKLCPIAPIMLKVVAHPKTQVESGHVSSKLVIWCSIEEVHARDAHEIGAIHAGIIEGRLLWVVILTTASGCRVVCTHSETGIDLATEIWVD